MNDQHTLIHNDAEKRYEIEVEGDKAIVEYILESGVITLTHTFVPQKHEGKGIGSELVKAVLDDIRLKGFQVVPQCEFIAQYIYRHPEYEDLVFKGIPAR